MVFNPNQTGTLPAPARELTDLARRAVEVFTRERRVIEPPLTPSSLLCRRAACFVSIKTGTGELRGCIGTIEPTQQTLTEELIANAIKAATEDPRFLPVTIDELPDLYYSIDVLSEIRPATVETLDPHRYGVLVEDETGVYRGLLLPDITGIESVSEQIEVAARKAGIPPYSKLKLHRFEVERFQEATFEN